MKKLTRTHKIALAGLLVAGALLAGSDAYFSSDQGGRLWSLNSGGEIDIASGATLAIASGATFTVGGVPFSPGPYVPITLADDQTIDATGSHTFVITAGTEADLVGGAGSGGKSVADATSAYMSSPDTNSFVGINDTKGFIDAVGAQEAHLAVVGDGTFSLNATDGSHPVAFTGDGTTGAAAVSGTTVAFAAGTSIAFDAAGSTDELGIAANSVSIGTAVEFRLPKGTAPPVACDASHEGSIYIDTDIHKLCVCNGTNYVLADDSSTTTGCS